MGRVIFEEGEVFSHKEDTIEILRDLWDTDIICSYDVHVNGEHPDVGSEVPSWFMEIIKKRGVS